MATTDYEDPIYTPGQKPQSDTNAIPPVQEEVPVEEGEMGKSPLQKATGVGRSEAARVRNAAGQPRYNVHTTIPDQFKGSNNKELIEYLERKIAEVKPLTEEDLKKLRRKQRAEGIISGISDAVQSVANLWYTHNYAPNMYDASQGMSAKAKARFEKEKAEREADADRYLNYALTIGKLKDADREAGLKAWELQQNLARQERAYEDARKDREADVEFRNRDYDERVRQYNERFEREGKWHDDDVARWQKQFDEGVRQFNISSENERRRINMEGSRLALQMQQGQMTFNLGAGKGNVTLTTDKLNAQTVSRIFSTLPEDVRSEVTGDPIVQGGMVVDYKEPTVEAMLIAIGANVDKSEETQNAIRELAGLRPVRSSTTNNGGDQTGNSNTSNQTEREHADL